MDAAGSHAAAGARQRTHHHDERHRRGSRAAHHEPAVPFHGPRLMRRNELPDGHCSQIRRVCRQFFACKTVSTSEVEEHEMGARYSCDCSSGPRPRTERAVLWSVSGLRALESDRMRHGRGGEQPGRGANAGTRSVTAATVVHVRVRRRGLGPGEARRAAQAAGERFCKPELRQASTLEGIAVASLSLSCGM